MITDFREPLVPAADSARKSCGSDKPATPSVPIFKKFRRERPSQKWEPECKRPFNKSIASFPQDRGL
jgi:hypothetical protein